MPTQKDKKERKVSAAFQKKQAQVVEIQKQLEDAKSVVFLDYRGINVAEDTALRNKFRDVGVVYKVYKNNLVRIALNNMGIKELDDQLVGTLSVAFSNNDEISAAKTILGEKFQDKMAFKFGLCGSDVLDEAGVKALATMPTKEQLIAQLMGLLTSGARGLATVVNAVPRNMAVVINAAVDANKFAS